MNFKLLSILFLGLHIGAAPTAFGQEDNKKAMMDTESDSKPTPEFSRKIDTQSKVVTNHEIMIGGQKVPYSATAGTQPVWAEDGHPIATLFYTYYQRTGVKDLSLIHI